jgi:hypothetical protein
VELYFNYIKGSMFRSVHVDGAIGGATPSGNLRMVFFNECGPLPTQEAMEVNPDGTMGNVLEDTIMIGSAVIREMETSVIMSLSTARAIVRLLQETVQKMEKEAIRH